MAFDGYLKIEKIPGESQDSKHEGWIPILSFKHTLEQKASHKTIGVPSRTTGRTEHGVFKVVKSLDKATPKLLLHCSNGKSVGKVTLDLCRALEDKQTYMQYIMEDVVVSAINYGGSASEEEAIPSEEVHLSYNKIEWIYTELDPDTVRKKGEVRNSWNLKTNTGA